MATCTSSIHIDAPVEKVFQFADDPVKMLEVWPSLVDVRDIMMQPNGGKTYEWTYKMAGVRLNGSSETLEYVPNERIVEKTLGGIESTITWSFTPDQAGTTVSVTSEYKIPFPVLGKLAEAFIVKLNEREAVLILANLKSRMEVPETIQNA